MHLEHLADEGKTTEQLLAHRAIAVWLKDFLSRLPDEVEGAIQDIRRQRREQDEDEAPQGSAFMEPDSGDYPA